MAQCVYTRRLPIYTFRFLIDPPLSLTNEVLCKGTVVQSELRIFCTFRLPVEAEAVLGLIGVRHVLHFPVASGKQEKSAKFTL